jgi:protein-tyrosine phosphatase
MKITIEDKPTTLLEQHFETCFNFIELARINSGRILVHCYQGRSRCVAIVIAYLMKYLNYSLDNALNAIRQVRPSAQPNTGFMKQLRDFESSLRL